MPKAVVDWFEGLPTRLRLLPPRIREIWDKCRGNHGGMAQIPQNDGATDPHRGHGYTLDEKSGRQIPKIRDNQVSVSVTAGKFRDRQLFCICHKKYEAPMIRCGYPECQILVFHTKCMGFNTQDIGKAIKNMKNNPSNGPGDSWHCSAKCIDRHMEKVLIEEFGYYRPPPLMREVHGFPPLSLEEYVLTWLKDPSEYQDDEDVNQEKIKQEKVNREKAILEKFCRVCEKRPDSADSVVSSAASSALNAMCSHSRSFSEAGVNE